MTITHRRLTEDEARLLHEELKTTPNILGYTVWELKRLTDVQVAEVDGAFAGVCFSIDLAAGWTEIAVLYVLPAFRGQGIGKTLFDAAWQRAEERGRHLYIMSRNPQVITWMQERGMTVNGQIWRAPLPVHWYMQFYMASWHRTVESLRKWRAIQAGASLVHGIKKAPPKGPA